MLKNTCVCGAELLAPEEYIGRKTRCKKCGAIHMIQAPPPELISDKPLISRGSDPAGSDHASIRFTIGLAIGTLVTATFVFFSVINEHSTIPAIVRSNACGDALLVVLIGFVIDMGHTLERIRRDFRDRK